MPKTQYSELLSGGEARHGGSGGERRAGSPNGPPSPRLAPGGFYALVVVVAALPLVAAEPGWTQWRGPGRDGFVAAADWPDGLSSERLERRWRIELGPSYSGPVLAGLGNGRTAVIVTETRDKKTEHVRAIDAATGAELWQAEWEGAMSVPFFAASNGSWIRATPCVDEGRVFVAGMRDVLVCLDAATGRENWRVDFMDAFESPLPSFGFVSSPLVIGEHVYVQAGGGFVKLDKASGEIVWRVLDDGGGMSGSAFSSPTLTMIGGLPQVLVQTRNDLAAVDPEQGTVLWKTPIKAFRGMNIVTPTVHNGKVFTTSYGGGSFLYAVDPASDEKPVEQLWRNKVQGYMSSPIVIGNHAYVHLRNQRFACLDLTSGEEAWITKPFGKYWSLVANGEMILALDETGELRLIRATPASFELVGEAKVAEDESWAHLAVEGRDIYVRDLEGLTAYRWQ
ncbi:MAG: PQQ-like beta-propeller repeat protein [Planctomycetota bacterium]|nr:PQQ-like beta-propeller repeat protein [Planctomycetota bacterium]